MQNNKGQNLIKLAFVFPGLGCEKPGMGSDLWEAFPSVRKTFQAVDTALQFNLSEKIFNATHADELPPTLALPGVLACRVSTAQLVIDALAIPQHFPYFAGHSFGEFSAITSAGLCDIGHVAYASAKTIEVMEEATPDQTGMMMAVMKGKQANLSPQEFRARIHHHLTQAGVTHADKHGSLVNDNSPYQVVISGHAQMINLAAASMKNDALISKRITQRMAAHTPLVHKASDKVMELLTAHIAIPAAGFKWMPNGWADVLPDYQKDTIVSLLAKQMAAPVYWRQTIERMQTLGVNCILECGPGNLLTSLIQRTAPEITAIALKDATAIQDFLASPLADNIRGTAQKHPHHARVDALDVA